MVIISFTMVSKLTTDFRRIHFHAIAAQHAKQLKAVDVRIEDVLRDVMAIAHTDLHTLTEESGVPIPTPKMPVVVILVVKSGEESYQGCTT